jgi:hypothetical protein
MLKCPRCFGDSGHRLAVERKVPAMNRIRDEHFVAATAPRLATSIGSRVSRPQTCFEMAKRDRCGGSRCGRGGHFRSFQSPASFVRIEDVGYGTIRCSKSSNSSRIPFGISGRWPMTITPTPQPIRSALLACKPAGYAAGLLEWRARRRSNLTRLRVSRRPGHALVPLGQNRVPNRVPR